MAKYSQEVLKDMAETVIVAEGGGDQRAVQLYITIYHLTGMAPAEVRNRIYELAGETHEG